MTIAQIVFVVIVAVGTPSVVILAFQNWRIMNEIEKMQKGDKK